MSGERSQDQRATIARMATVIAEALFEHMEQSPRSIRAIWPTCIACMNWDQKRELCKLNGCRPPAEIIVNGCECFTTIPF
jgi:hypothetical protein